ncbi:MAG: hypothetical protein EBU46_05615, partial [Nitrosomonadaceae bacterium]|nr:hypothetical protein [Nitrosomonadaceae bacterium]
ATLATSATTASNATNATHAALADNATNAEEAVKATNALNLAIAENDYRPGTYFRNAGNLNAGILLAARFNDVSHGQRAGGNLHATANETTAGFFSAADFCKLQTIEANAQENENVFTSFVGTSGSTSAASKTATFKFDSDSPALSIVVTGGSNPTATFSIDPAQITHADLGALDADDHTNYVHKSINRTITALHTFNATGGVPFIVGSNARGSIVTGLNADLLDGQHGAFYQNAANLSSGIIPTARLSGTYTINITGTASGNVPLTGGTTEGPLNVPGLTVGSLNGVLRAVNGEVLDGATTDDLTEGNANLFFTNERVDDRVAALLQNNTHITWTYNDTNGTLTPTLSGVPTTTDDLPEGEDNLYLTVARVRAALSAVAPITYNSSTGAIGINADYVNTPNTLVYRDSNGDFAARNITVATPTAGGHAANKTYVDTVVATKAASNHSHSNATTTTAGFMSPTDKANHDALAVLVDNIKRARSFCSTLRLEGPSSANVLFYNQKSTIVKGDPDKTYTLTVRVRGWFKEQHTWALIVDNATPILIHEASASLPGPQSSDTYVDEERSLTVHGRSRISLVYYLRDGLLPSSMPGPLAGVAPKDVAFNGSYLLIEPVALEGDYHCYTKDMLPVSINGEIVGGLLSGYSGDDGLNGDDADDIDEILATYANAAETPAFPDYTAEILGKVDASQRKSQASVLNKIDGFNGYLQHQAFIIGRDISKPIAASNDALDETLVNSGKTYANITTSTFSVGGTSATITIGGSTNWQQLLDQIGSTSGGVLAATYNATTDRITIVNTASPAQDHEADVYYAPDSFLGIIRASANGSHRNSAISLPVASGIRLSDTLKNANFKLAVYPESGSFYIDGVVYTYDSTTDTVAGLMATINESATTQISYDALSNTFKLAKRHNMVAPVAFDITGNFLEATRLERESAGNHDFPQAAVHCVKLLDERIFVGGSFLNFKGASTAGLAKLDYNKQLFSQFNPDVGFDQPVAFIEPLYGTDDVLVGTFEPSCYRGYNRKYLHRIKPDGTEETSFNFNTQLATTNGQDRVLKALSLNNNNDIAILTPRKLIVVDATGSTLCSYNGTKGFHSFVKYSDNNFLLASTAYSTAAAAQKWDTDSVLPLDEPLGLKWLTYNASNHTIAADSVWLQTPTVVNNQLGAGAGTGAEASCAYPIIGKTGTNDAYVIAGNRGNLWGSGYTAFDAVGDTSWNSREVGNLLLRSDLFAAPEGGGYNSWPWEAAGNIDITSEEFGTDELWTTLSRPSANDVSYVEQFVDMTTVRSRLDLADVANPGSVQYRYMVKFIQDTGFNNKFPVINVRLTGGSNTNDRQVNCYVNLATGAVTLGTPTPSNLTGVTVNSTTVDGGSGPDTYIVTISFQDDVVANTSLYCTIYPAYATVAGNPVEATTGSCRISGASLMLTAWPNTYVKTTTARKYPAAGSNGIRFRGLYKVGLVGQKKGGADANWNCQLDLIDTGDDVHSHPIPFCVDSLDRVYVGGPIKRIKNSNNAWVNVTPWRLYRLTANGFFDKEYEFNDKVLCATITSCNKLIVGGKFSSLGKRFAGKLAFMSVDGALLDSLNNYIDIIAAPLAPDVTDDPCLKNKLWLDTTEVPSILKAYNNESSEWLAAVDVDSLVPRLPKPEFVVTYPIPGQNVNPSAIYLVVPGHSNATIYYAINSDPRVLPNRQDYNPVTGIVLEDAGTFTINVYATKTNFEDSHLATDTFTVQAVVGVLEFTPASNEQFTTGGSVTIDVPTTNAETIHYQVAVNGGSYSAEALYTGSLNIEQNVAIRARASRTGYRDALASAVYTVVLPDPIIAYTRINQSDTNSSRVGITLASNVQGSVVRYTLDGSTPTSTSTLYTSTIDLLNNNLYTDNTFTLKAKAFHPDNGTESAVVTEVVTRLTGITATPNGTGLLEGQTLTLAGSGGTNEFIRYTINGSTPTEAGSGGVTYTNPITFAPEDIVNHQVTVKARVFKLGDEPNWHPGIPSTLFNIVYTVQMPPPTIGVVNDPTLGVTRITLTSVNPQTPTASIIRYTTDGSTPSKLSGNASTTTYVAPGIVTANIPENHFINGIMTLKVIEYYPADNYTPAVATQTFTRAAAPSSLIPANNVVVFGEPVTVVAATNDSYSFYYSVNQNGAIDGSSIGTAYNALTGLIFNNAQIHNGSVALKIRAFRSGFLPSSTVSTTYSMKLPTVYFDPFSGSVNPGTVAMYNLVNGVTIKYTRNGAAPNNSSITYTTPVEVRISATFKAKAIKADWIDSEVSTSGYISTLYPSTPDHSLFNLKFGQAVLEDVSKVPVFKFSAGAVVFQGRPNSGEYASKNIFLASEPTATISGNGSYYINIDKSQLKASGKAAFGLTDVDYWNSLDVSDNELWKPLRNYGATGNFGNYLEARKFFGCSRAALVVDPRNSDGVITEPQTSGTQLVQPATAPTLLQNSGLTATPDSTNKHVMAHVRGLAPGKYLVIAYGRKTRFGIDMYSGTSVT